jgi:ferredoxin
VHVTFTPIGHSADARPDETILDVARRAGVPLGNSCGGIGVCSRCKVKVVEGAASLTPITSMESTRVTDDERLACQAVVQGNCTVTATYW